MEKSSVLQAALAFHQACHLALFLSAHLLSRCYTNLLSPQRISRHVLLRLFLMSTFLLSRKQWQAGFALSGQHGVRKINPSHTKRIHPPILLCPFTSFWQETLQWGQTRDGWGFPGWFKSKSLLGVDLPHYCCAFLGREKRRKVASQMNSHVFTSRSRMHTQYSLISSNCFPADPWAQPQDR